MNNFLAIGDRVVFTSDPQWTGAICGVGTGEVKVRWDHQQDAPSWVAFSEVSRVPR